MSLVSEGLKWLMRPVTCDKRGRLVAVRPLQGAGPLSQGTLRGREESQGASAIPALGSDS
ncbi:hypothetical protein Sviol_22950 [Streptomyces violascens]|uniref:Transposase n=1 Tax=Streptomyces violascens TaxID=67381 RepID=A0ABQ3QKS2_9ACTN|nr:hypothetical protein Sviol_22900 [Streptomyces violascens]GHI37887.1 hypothetical protein Sviol_22950 [Streptomyces violascens]